MREGEGGPSRGAVVGRGRTAEIRAWGDGQVVKLYDAGLPSRLIDAEVVATRVAAEAGALAPAFGGRVLVDGRDGLVMERVEGTHMVALLRSAPWRALRCAAQLARLQAAINARAGDGLEPLRERLDTAIRSASSLTPVARDGALAALAVLPDGGRLCHGDLHPENVILSPRGPVVLDWMTAAAGDPAADVARTSLILSVASIPGARARDRALLRAGRGLLHRSFMRHRLRAGDVDGRSVRAWALPVAAARLAEGIDDERETLLDIVRRLSVERADP